MQAREKLSELNNQLLEKNNYLLKINMDLDNFIYTALHNLKSPVTNLEGLMRIIKETTLVKASEKDLFLLNIVDTFAIKSKTIPDQVEITKVQKDIEQSDEEPVSFSKITEGVKSDVKALLEEGPATIKQDFLAGAIQYKGSN